MTKLHLSRPEVVLGPIKVTNDEVTANIRAHHPNHKKIKSIPRHIANTSVRTRYLSHKLDSPYVGGSVDGGSAGIGDRIQQAYSDAVGMGLAAGHQLFDAYGVAPEEVDVFVSSHSVSGGKLPGFDLPLANGFGLRRNIRRIPLATAACAGGATVIARAADMVLARPDDKVLCVVSEPLSTTYHHSDTDVQQMIFKGLFGDAATAVFGTGTPLGPGLRVEDTLEIYLPGTSGAYFTRPDAEAIHFGASEMSLDMVEQCLPDLTSWLAGQQVDVAVVHTGSPGIINSVARVLGLDERAVRVSHNSLQEIGNVGGNAVLDGLARLHADPPKAGDKVVIVGFGPGFVMVACWGVWCA